MGAPGCPTPDKRGYKSPSIAQRHMWQLLTKGTAKRRDWQRLNVYRCRCGLFHVGHSHTRVI